MLDRTVTVVENRPLPGGHFLLSVDAPEQAPATRPGQFAMIRLLGRSDVLLRRPMSIYDVKQRWEIKSLARAQARQAARAKRDAEVHSLAETGSAADISDASANPSKISRKPSIIQVLYKVVGRGTRLMAALEAGGQVGLLGPLGHGFFPEEYLDRARTADEVLQVAGGIGIAALLLPARDLAQAGVRQRLFFGGRTRDDLVGVAGFRPLVEAAVLATENGSRGHQGYVTRPLQAYLERHRDRRFLLMACGPWAMLAATADLACRYSHPCLVSMENRMGCALGVCLGCSIPVRGTGHGSYERVCTEGPVFWADHVVW